MRWRDAVRPGAGMRARRRTGGAESCGEGVRDGGKARVRTVITGRAVSEETRWNWCGNWLIQGGKALTVPERRDDVVVPGNSGGNSPES
jgi:hypothetical protein